MLRGWSRKGVMFLEELDCCWSSNLRMRWKPSLSSLDESFAVSGKGADAGAGSRAAFDSGFGAKNPVNLDGLPRAFFGCSSAPTLVFSFFVSSRELKKPLNAESKTNGVSALVLPVLPSLPDRVRSWFGPGSGEAAVSWDVAFEAFILSFHRWKSSWV